MNRTKKKNFRVTLKSIASKRRVLINNLLRGKASKWVATKYGYTTQQVAAVKAHITMGTYA